MSTSVGWLRGAVLVRAAAILGWLVVAATVWLQWDCWRQVDHLEAELLAWRAGQASPSGQVRLRLEGLRGALVRLRLLRRPAGEIASFQAQARELGEVLAADRLVLSHPEAAAVQQRLEAAWAECLSQAAALLDEPMTALRREVVEETSERVARMMEPVVRASEELALLEAISLKAEEERLGRRLAMLGRRQAVALGLLAGLGLIAAVWIGWGTVVGRAASLGADRVDGARREKLASLGTLAAGVAHEIRNPLTALKLRLFSLKRELPPEWADHDDLRVIDREIHRLDRIVQGFLGFGRPAAPAPTEMAVAGLLQDVEAVLRPELDKRGVRLVLEAPVSFSMRADRQQLQQVLINLVQNAADSLKEGGTVSLRAGLGMGRLGGRSQATVVLEVSDTGPGIPPEVQRRLFDPYFTTKEGGTGLGLAIAARIVEKHGGLIQYRTDPHRGTTFQVVFPRDEDHGGPDTTH